MLTKRLQISLLSTGFIGLFFMMSSCNLGVSHMEFVSLDDAVWDSGHKVVFEIQPKDNETSYDWFIHLRSTQDYPYSNLYLITELSSENKVLRTDTIAYTMANPDGSWRGTPSGSLVEHKILYQSQMPFSGTQTHTLSIRQAMRALGSIEPLQHLEGVSDIGYSIETKANE